MYELETVLHYVGILLKGAPSREPVEQKEIGIIAPYIRQVYKLKAKLKDKGWENIEVGTTETFQGREKRVILISTVRSNRNLLDHDSKFGLGFLANPKVCCFFQNSCVT
jgi:superfamily I DNA and/or RNA helicase